MAGKRHGCSCGCLEGELHKFGCDKECCPFCGYQLGSCNCRYTKLGMTVDRDAPFSGLPEVVYRNGLSDEQEARWLKILEERGRIPFIQYGLFCARCGAPFSDMYMWMVPDWEWERYIEPRMQGRYLCRPCYDEIKWLIDVHAGLPEPVMVLCPYCHGDCLRGEHQCPVCRGRGQIAESGVAKHNAWRQMCEEEKARYACISAGLPFPGLDIAEKGRIE